jgi:hypothetical protein
VMLGSVLWPRRPVSAVPAPAAAAPGSYTSAPMPPPRL